ncbi:unnamed protein product [Clonostachys rhizophaga]|uniref:Rhodopsin domain-containing protein n=1 Tax=Clonostachys rhizophaga TaxID=160324 RepID=A0A9N9YWC6_9HYPO|nr:unnamed protein product [Clonostachys rhizophaga]
MVGFVPNILGATITTFAVALLALTLRMVALYLTRRPPFYDDYLCIFAFVSFRIWLLHHNIDMYCHRFLFTSAMIRTFQYYLGQFPPNVDQDKLDCILEKSRQLLWIIELTYAASIASSKFSVLCFFWNIFNRSSIRWPIIILFLTSFLWVIVRTFIVIFQCTPVPYIWDKSIQGGRCPIDISKFFFGTVLLHCVMDTVIVMLPIFPVLKMQLSQKRKAAILALFASGAIVVIASVFVLIESIKYDPLEAEITYHVAPNMLWAAVEVNMAVFSSKMFFKTMTLSASRDILRGDPIWAFNSPQHVPQDVSNKRLKGPAAISSLQSELQAF